jgi:hypothetical protein
MDLQYCVNDEKAAQVALDSMLRNTGREAFTAQRILIGHPRWAASTIWWLSTGFSGLPLKDRRAACG